MDSKRAGGVAIFGIITLAIIWGLLSFVPLVTSAPRTVSSTSGQNEQAAVSNTTLAPHITVMHRYAEGIHTYSGTLSAPTPCHTLDASTSVMYALVPKVTLALVLNAPAPDTVCAQVVTTQEFTTSVTSKQAPELVVTVDGAPVEVVLKEK